jgi:magnesium transporter
LPVAADKSELQSVTINLIRFHEDGDCVTKLSSSNDLAPILKLGEFIWIDVFGPIPPTTLQEIGQLCGIHPLALEDLSNTHQRPKIEQYALNTYIVLRGVRMAEHLETDQINIIVGKQFVLTAHVGDSDSLASVKDRVQRSRHRSRFTQSGSFAYTIMDLVIDGYFPVLEHFADRLDHLEEQLLSAKRVSSLVPIYEVKNDLILLRRLVWAQRDLLAFLLREPPKTLDQDISLYLRDCYDHTLQQLDLIEIYRESASSLIDHVYSSATHKTNEIMKVLTIVSAIFIPLNFVAGVYGMNFNTASSPFNMPELGAYYGYPTILGMMAAIGLTLLWVFHRNNWV